MEHAELSFSGKMDLILPERGLIPNSSPSLTDPLEVTHQEPGERPSLPLSGSQKLSSWLLAVGLQRLGRFIYVIIHVSEQLSNSQLSIVVNSTPCLSSRIIFTPPPPLLSPTQPS
jgi:hypothetical protein